MDDVYYIRIIGLLALPIAILWDSQRRLGKKRWGWALGMFLLGWGGISQHAQMVNTNVSVPPIDIVLGELAAVWLFGFGLYRLFTRGQKVFQRIDKKTTALLQDEKVILFYKNTLAAYSCGKMSALGKGFEELGRLPYDKFVELFPPNLGTALHLFFSKTELIEDEFLVATQRQRGGWFVLTNCRLFQKDGKSGQFKTVTLKNVKHYEIKERFRASLHFELSTGENVDFAKVSYYPKSDTIREVLNWQNNIENSSHS